LGESADGVYERETSQVHARFVSGCDRRSLARARLVRLVRPRKFTILADAAARAGLAPWYRHPRIVFDFDRMRWTLQ